MKTYTRFTPKPHIRKGDMVLVRSGDDKGKKARVLEVLPMKGVAYVEGVNLMTHHVKPNSDKDNPKGGIIKKEGPVAISKLMVMDAKGNATRIGRREEGGKSVRYSKKSQEVIK